ncbi:2786_t:CDS:2 [Ambispora gerdemannii]|uniref:2786_t:CDS:1 n=1 Tax=Ambispora gerdemannii TaxID=144530 RepID=A0A9N9FTF6_9GLOM|nr:2786_t:CDS:2 [Ambispora gerdemannii]
MKLKPTRKIPPRVKAPDESQKLNFNSLTLNTQLFNKKINHVTTSTTATEPTSSTTNSSSSSPSIASIITSTSTYESVMYYTKYNLASNTKANAQPNLKFETYILHEISLDPHTMNYGENGEEVVFLGERKKNGGSTSTFYNSNYAYSTLPRASNSFNYNSIATFSNWNSHLTRTENNLETGEEATIGQVIRIITVLIIVLDRPPAQDNSDNSKSLDGLPHPTPPREETNNQRLPHLTPPRKETNNQRLPHPTPPRKETNNQRLSHPTPHREETNNRSNDDNEDEDDSTGSSSSSTVSDSDSSNTTRSLSEPLIKYRVPIKETAATKNTTTIRNITALNRQQQNLHSNTNRNFDLKNNNISVANDIMNNKQPPNPKQNFPALSNSNNSGRIEVIDPTKILIEIEKSSTTSENTNSANQPLNSPTSSTTPSSSSIKAPSSKIKTATKPSQTITRKPNEISAENSSTSQPRERLSYESVKTYFNSYARTVDPIDLLKSGKYNWSQSLPHVESYHVNKFKEFVENQGSAANKEILGHDVMRAFKEFHKSRRDLANAFSFRR